MVDHIHGVDEADPAVLLTGVICQGGGQMGLAGAGWAEDNVGKAGKGGRHHMGDLE